MNEAINNAILGAEPVPPTPWPSLIRLDAPRLPSLDRMTIPGWAGDYAAALSDATETPFELAASMVLAACSTAVARRYRVAVSHGYVEPCNLWIAVALPPGTRKSAVLSAAMSPIRAWEQMEAERLEPEIRQAQSRFETMHCRIKALRNKAAGADSRNEAEMYEAEISELEAGLPEVPKAPQLWTSDSTAERLGILLADNAERMAWLSTEGGIFEVVGGRYSKGVPNLDLLLKAHCGDSERVDRTGRASVYLDYPLLTIGLSPQPDVLHALSDKPSFRGRGLLGRFLWLLPPSPLGFRELVTIPIPDKIAHAYAVGLADILNREPVVDGDGKPHPIDLQLSDGAEAARMTYARSVEARMRPGSDFEYATDWAGKAPGALVRLAGVFHVLSTRDPAPPISLETMERAISVMDVCASHALAAFDLIGADRTTDSARRVWAWISRHRQRKFTEREVFQALKSTFHIMSNLEPALAVLVERGYARHLDIVIPQRAGRRASPTYEVRPELALSWT